MRHLLYAGAFALCAFLLVPQAVLAQQGDGPRTAEQLVIDVDRSDVLHQEAFRMEADNRNWNEVAKRYVESAQLRPYGDLQAYVALNRAGKMFSHADKTRDAYRAFANAGIRALETGHVYEAAMAYANAAEIAQKDRRSAHRVVDYAHTAHRLSEAPALTDDQRKQIQERLGAAGS